jgi:hypothetical protein
MTRYILSWNSASDGTYGDKEDFTSIKEGKARIEELKQAIPDLEWDWYEIRKCKHCNSWYRVEK